MEIGKCIFVEAARKRQIKLADNMSAKGFGLKTSVFLQYFF